MGMDWVELVVDLEEAFDVNLPAEQFPLKKTVGEVHDLIMPILKQSAPEDVRTRMDLDSYCFHMLAEKCRMIAGKSDLEITRETRFREDLGFD